MRRQKENQDQHKKSYDYSKISIFRALLSQSDVKLKNLLRLRFSIPASQILMKIKIVPSQLILSNKFKNFTKTLQ